MRPEDVGTQAFPWHYAFSLTRHAQAGTALFSVLSARPPEANTLELLRMIEHGVRTGTWIHSKDATNKRNYPEVLELPWDPPPEGAIRGDSMEWDEAAAFLGWEVEMARFFGD